VDAQCDKLATAVRQTKLTTLLTTDMWWQKKQKNWLTTDMWWQKTEKLAKFRVFDKIPEGSTLISEDT